MQNYRRLFFLVCIITVSIAVALNATVIPSPFKGMSESLEISIIKLGNERPQVQQRVAGEIKDMNVSHDQILLAWARLSLLFHRSGVLEREHWTDHWLRTTHQVFSLVDLDKTSPGLLDTFTDGTAGDSALALDTFIIQLGDKNPQIKQDAAAAIKDMNLSDDQLLLAYAKVVSLLFNGRIAVYDAPWELFENIDDAVLRLIDLDEALRGVLPLLKSADKDEAILARFVIHQIGRALDVEGSRRITPPPKDEPFIKPNPGTVPLLAESLKDPNAEIRETASRLLGIIATHAEAAVPALIVALNDENQDVQTAAVAASGKIAAAIPAVHPEIVKTLIALPHDRRYVQLAAVDALRDIAKAVPAVQLEIAERLIQLLNTPNFLIPPWGLKPRKSHGLQRRSLDFSDFHVRVAGHLDSIGAAAVPLLVEAMDATDPGVRHYAAIALAGISPEHDEATIPILIEALASPYSTTRESVIYCFVDLAKRQRLVVPVLNALVRLLESTGDTVENRIARPEAVSALYRVITSSIYNPEEDSSTPVVNPEQKLEIVEKLIAALNTPNFVTGLFGRGRGRPVIGMDLDFVSNYSGLYLRTVLSNFHVDVAYYLGLIGAAAVPGLAEAMKATDAGVRHHAAIALAGISPEHEEATIPILTEALDSPNLHTREAADYELKYTLKRPAKRADPND